MVQAAESVTAELAHAQRQVDRLHTGRTQLSIATFTSGGRFLLPGALARFTAAHPTPCSTSERANRKTACRWSAGALSISRSRSPTNLALAYHFDGPLPGQVSQNPAMRWIALMQDPLYAVLPVGHHLTDRTALDIAELAAEPWVLGCSKTDAYLRRYARQAGFDPEIRGTTTDYYFARSLVAAGMGISLIPSIALTPEEPGVRVVAIKQPAPTRHIGLATISRRHHPQLRTLIDALQEQAPAPDAM
ncbi:LysR substrate-binding domain-containing protein [Streptomyces sp. NPDC005562]|uniref:LysR substrate-binding domain-containing protein n=1 Tax=Streptomyces sp. NPDC005562 TaxID=3154890 RepID=UPI0033B92BA4